ncbi:MAG: exodeoxyribonuclease VII large subunit [Tannerella sp.]|jgi:exodeoxyribonuclease VII large subunit|nr:exodeoxyribonuclease VII large subunit [Tannerella sp.]
MSEKIKDKTVFSLTEVMKSVQNTLTERYKSAFWVKAEMNKLNYYKHSGHCYPDLIEKQNGKIVAQIRAILWGDDYRRIDDLFRKTLNEPLKDGIKILFLAKIAFDASHGLTLRIFDIDPDYTLGDLEKEKQETIRKLRDEGIFANNKSLQMTVLPKRIAIISVETSKGYKDFLGKIDNNPWGYVFFHFLFPSVLQGDGIIKSITAQLRRIRSVKQHFDAVAIVRGGGGETGLASYNNYELAREIALFPLPVLTGIGHITNETITEMVAYRNLITPTDLADFFLQQFHNFAVPVRQAGQRLSNIVNRMLNSANTKFNAETKLFRSGIETVILKHQNHITLIADKLADKSAGVLREERLRLDSIEKNVANLDPKEVMRRGYSITIHNGKAVRKVSGLKADDTLQTILYEGNIISTIQTINKEKL